jgi:hypothetical protein
MLVVVFLPGVQTEKHLGLNTFLYQAKGVQVNARRALPQWLVTVITIREVWITPNELCSK